MHLRIVQYLPTIRLSEGGVARAVLDWCKVLGDAGHDVALMCHDAADVPDSWKTGQKGLPRLLAVPLPAAPLKSLGYFQLPLVGHDMLKHADVLHLHAPWLMGNLRMAALARRYQVPYLLSVHGMLDDWSMSQRTLKKRVYLAMFARRLLDAAAAVHFTADAELVQARKWFSNPKTAVLPCLVDLDPMEQLPGPELAMQLLPADLQNSPKVLFLGRLHEKKGVDILIRALSILQDASPACILLIAGTGEPAYEQHLQRLVEKLKLKDRVLFLGLITGKQKLSLCQASDVFALPTQQENFGLAIVEAMACGMAVLTTSGTDIWKEIQTAGAVITDRTPQAFAREIKILLDNPVDRVSRGVRGRQWVFDRLAAAPLGKKYEALYQSLASQKRGSPGGS